MGLRVLGCVLEASLLSHHAVTLSNPALTYTPATHGAGSFPCNAASERSPAALTKDPSHTLIMELGPSEVESSSRGSAADMKHTRSPNPHRAHVYR